MWNESIRPARPDDALALQKIELLAGERFREVGMDAIADAKPDSLELLTHYARVGRAWVVVDDQDNSRGYVRVDEVDGNAHVAQVSVTPAAQGCGLGRALLDCVRTWATETGKPMITLTTFRDVPWNMPLYEHFGFKVLVEAEIGPELSAQREMESLLGLDPATRVCMFLQLRS